jgi:hypothetical protein
MDVVDIDKAKKKRAPRRKKAEGGEEVPSWKVPSRFPEDAAGILQKQKISRKQFSRYIEQLSLYILTNFSADFAISLQRMIRKGDKVGMEMFGRTMGLLKNDSAVTVNLQNNLQVNQGATDRSFDSLVRMLDERERNENAITVASEAKVIEASKIPDTDTDE